MKAAVSLHLRRFLLVHAFSGHRFQLWPSPGADRRHHDDAHGGCGCPAVPVFRSRRHRAPVPHSIARTLATDKRDEIKERNREISEGVYEALKDPKKTLVPPKAEDVPPYLNFAPARAGLRRSDRSRAGYDKAFDAAAGNAPARIEHVIYCAASAFSLTTRACPTARGSSTFSMRPASTRLWREDDSRRARSHRAEALG